MSDWPQASRNTDPDSSHEAEAEHTASGRRSTQMAECVKWVKRLPGSTAGELCHMSGMTMHVMSRRLSDARARGLIMNGEQRKCIRNNRKQLTWWMTRHDDD